MVEANGRATVTATVGDVSGSPPLIVDQRTTRLQVSPDSVRLTAIGDTQWFEVEAADARGRTVGDDVSLPERVYVVDPATGAVELLRPEEAGSLP